MKRASALLLMAAACYAEDGSVERGSRLYRTHCAIPYCHGPDGGAGRAPRLAGHHLNVNTMFKVITWGIPSTGMPEFTTRLKTSEIADLVAYVMTLGSAPVAPDRAPVIAERALTPQAKEGRALFFDAARTGYCGTCHELDGKGVPIALDLAALPPGMFTNLRVVATRGVVTARPTGEPPFPALLVERNESKVRVYDLTAALPVLRTFAAARIVIEPSSSWSHEQATRVYTDGELEVVAGYLRWRTGQ
jgi:mono/diheme cytochrome c family protein